MTPYMHCLVYHVPDHMWQYGNLMNYLMILNIYKEQLDDVDLSSIANEFVCGSEHRMHVFGKF